MTKRMRFSIANSIRIYLEAIWTARGGRSRIEARQLQKLRQLVDLARKKSPLFSEIYKGLPPTAAVTLKDLPVTRKRDLMAQFDRWLTDRTLVMKNLKQHMTDLSNLGVPIGEVAVFRTSGSSGEPAVVVVPALMLEFTVGVGLAFMNRRMFKILRTVARSGVNVSITGGNGHFAGIGVSLLIGRLMPRLSKKIEFIPAEAPLDKIVARLNAIKRIASITTYPSVLMLLVHEKEAGRLKADPKLFKTAGETLTEELRARTRKAFPEVSWPILNAYAATECFLIGPPCSSGRNHLPENWVILEAVDEQYRPVEDGVLSHTCLLTVFANQVQPFIRYDLGDRVRFYKDSCPCGSPFRSFQVEGRQATLLHVQGVKLSPLIFDLEHHKALRVQMAQLSDWDFEVRIEAEHPDEAESIFGEVKTAIQKVFDNHNLFGISISLSAQPPRVEASGKFHEILPLRH